MRTIPSYQTLTFVQLLRGVYTKVGGGDGISEEEEDI